MKFAYVFKFYAKTTLFVFSILSSSESVGKGSQLRYRLWKLSGEPPETVYKIWGLRVFL